MFNCQDTLLNDLKEKLAWNQTSRVALAPFLFSLLAERAREACSQAMEYKQGKYDLLINYVSTIL